MTAISYRPALFLSVIVCHYTAASVLFYCPLTCPLADGFLLLLGVGGDGGGGGGGGRQSTRTPS